jgi:hypothetical protein
LNIDGVPHPLDFKKGGTSLSVLMNHIPPLFAKFRAHVLGHSESYKQFASLACILLEAVTLSCGKVLALSGGEEGKKEKELAKNLLNKLATVASELKTLGNISLDGSFFERLCRMKFAKKIAQRSDVLNIGEDDLLTSLESSEWTLTLQRSQASLIDPWLIRVVSAQKSLTFLKDVFAFHEYGIGNPVEDGLFESKEGMAFTFTRTPQLYIPSMTAALKNILWCKLVENFYFGKEKNVSLQDIIELQKTLPISNDARKALDDILLNDRLALSEADGILSVCMLLGAMASLKEMKISSKVAFALLVESVGRGCKSYLKSFTSFQSREDVICKILGINEKTTAENYVFEKEKVTKRAGKILFQMIPLTNCSPFCVVACLTFLQKGGQEPPSHSLMSDFLKQHAKTEDKQNAQIALVLDGIMRRRDGDFSDSSFIVKGHIQKMIEIMDGKRLNEQRALGRVQKRKEERKTKGSLFAEYHVFPPKTFTLAQIEEMNKSRPLDNQLELVDMGGGSQRGLLKHHCCYPNCPDYLQTNFKTTKDVSFKMRKGLMRHFAFDLEFQGTYFPSLHKFTLAAMRSGTRNIQEVQEYVFVELLRTPQTESYVKRWGQGKVREMIEKIFYSLK